VNDVQIHEQEVDAAKSRRKQGLGIGAERPRPARVQNSSPFQRQVLKGDRPGPYYRIVETLREDLANQFGMVDLHLQHVLAAVKERFPEYSRPTCGDVWRSVIIGAAAGDFERIASGPDRVIVRFPRKAGRS